MTKQEKTIAIIEAGGTGVEVADVFKKVVKNLVIKISHFYLLKINLDIIQVLLLHYKKNSMTKIGKICKRLYKKKERIWLVFTMKFKLNQWVFLEQL